MRKHLVKVVEYDPVWTPEIREAWDRRQVRDLAKEEPEFKPVRVGRKLISDYRARLYVTLESVQK